MATNHLTKDAYRSCDVNSDAFQAIILANKRVILTVIREFDRIRVERGFTEIRALNDLRSVGLIISRNGLNQFRRGNFHTSSTTYLNILSRWAGYSDMGELLCAVRDRELGRIK